MEIKGPNVLTTAYYPARPLHISSRSLVLLHSNLTPLTAAPSSLSIFSHHASIPALCFTGPLYLKRKVPSIEERSCAVGPRTERVRETVERT